MKAKLVFFLIISSQFLIAQIVVQVKDKTELFRDYEQGEKVLLLEKGSRVEILPKRKAHLYDSNYWRFDLQINNASILVKYGNTLGYVNFFDLESLTSANSLFFKKFSNKVLVPKYYCDSLYRLDLEIIKKVDPFSLKYDDGIKYLFIDDRNPEWYFNYPINYSFLNDCYLQISSIPGRYAFNAFIVNANDESFDCIIDTNLDQFHLFDNWIDYETEVKYKFKYSIDGDYICISDGDREIFKGVFIERKTWEYIYYFITKRKDNIYYNEFFQKPNMAKIDWPKHSNNISDYN